MKYICKPFNPPTCSKVKVGIKNNNKTQEGFARRLKGAWNVFWGIRFI